jgi:hypothetical protein
MQQPVLMDEPALRAGKADCLSPAIRSRGALACRTLAVERLATAQLVFCTTLFMVSDTSFIRALNVLALTV